MILKGMITWFPERAFPRTFVISMDPASKLVRNDATVNLGAKALSTLYIDAVIGGFYLPGLVLSAPRMEDRNASDPSQ